MAFSVSDINMTALHNLNELKNYITSEKENICFTPIEDFISSDALFVDDEFYGRGKKWVSFNTDSFQVFCSKFGIPYSFINSLSESGLTSKVLNDYFTSNSMRNELKNHQFVIDKSSSTVVGIVSKTYLSYSNKEFLDDLEKAFPKLLTDYEMQESYSINTKLYLRLLSPKIISGYARGDYYEGDDFSKIGLQLTNSMVGNSSVRVAYFIYRAICSNGLIVQVGNGETKVMHSGKKESFFERLKNNISPVFKDLKKLPQILKDLVAIEFNLNTIIDIGGAELIYKIIPLSKYEDEKRRKAKKEALMEFDYHKLSSYITKYAGEYSKEVFYSHFRNNRSMFDYINIFTEYAHSPGVNYKERVRIEERTGDFVNWVIRNKAIINRKNSEYRDDFNGQLSLWDIQ